MKIKKKVKPATEAQKRARERNWNKGQVLCLRTIANNIRRAKTTQKEEKITLEVIINDLNKILHNWVSVI